MSNIEINGKQYDFCQNYDDSGSSYHEVELRQKLGRYTEWWDRVEGAHVLCGKCKGDLFKVSSCNSNYESWAYCPCGNKFILHSG